MATNWNAQVKRLKAVKGPDPLPGPPPLPVTRPVRQDASSSAKTTETQRPKEKKEVQEMGGVKFVVQRLNSNASRRNRPNSAKSKRSGPVSSQNTSRKADDTTETGTASDADLPLTVAGAVALGFATVGSVLVSVGFGGGLFL